MAFLLLGALLGLPPDPDDDEALTLTLRAFRLHGLIEPVGGADGPSVLSTLAEAAYAIGRFSLADFPQLLEEFLPGEVHASLRLTRELGEALRAVPAGLADHLAADQLAEVLLEDSPTAVVLRLVCWQAIRRETGRLRTSRPSSTPLRPPAD